MHGRVGGVVGGDRIPIRCGMTRKSMEKVDAERWLRTEEREREGRVEREV